MEIITLFVSITLVRQCTAVGSFLQLLDNKCFMRLLPTSVDEILREVEFITDRWGYGKITIQAKTLDEVKPLLEKIRKLIDTPNPEHYVEISRPNKKTWRKLYGLSKLESNDKFQISFEFTWIADKCRIKFLGEDRFVRGTIAFDTPHRPTSGGIIRIKLSKPFESLAELGAIITALEVINQTQIIEFASVAMLGKKDADYTLRLYSITDVHTATPEDNSISFRFGFVDRKRLVKIEGVKEPLPAMVAYDKPSEPLSGIVRFPGYTEDDNRTFLEIFQTKDTSMKVQVAFEDEFRFRNFEQVGFRNIHGLHEPSSKYNTLSFRFKFTESVVFVKVPEIGNIISGKVYFDDVKEGESGTIRIWTTEIDFTPDGLFQYLRKRPTRISHNDVSGKYFIIDIATEPPNGNTQWRKLYVKDGNITSGLYRGQEYLTVDFSWIDERVTMRVSGTSKEFDGRISYVKQEENAKPGIFRIWPSKSNDINQVKKHLEVGFGNNPKMGKNFKDYTFLEVASHDGFPQKTLNPYGCNLRFLAAENELIVGNVTIDNISETYLGEVEINDVTETTKKRFVIQTSPESKTAEMKPFLQISFPEFSKSSKKSEQVKWKTVSEIEVIKSADENKFKFRALWVDETGVSVKVKLNSTVTIDGTLIFNGKVGNVKNTSSYLRMWSSDPMWNLDGVNETLRSRLNVGSIEPKNDIRETFIEIEEPGLMGPHLRKLYGNPILEAVKEGNWDFYIFRISVVQNPQFSIKIPNTKSSIVKGSIEFNEGMTKYYSGEIMIWSFGTPNLPPADISTCIEKLDSKRFVQIADIPDSATTMMKWRNITVLPNSISIGNRWGQAFLKFSFELGEADHCSIRLVNEFRDELKGTILYDQLTGFSGEISLLGNPSALKDYLDKLKTGNNRNPNPRDIHNYSCAEIMRIGENTSYDPIYGITYIQGHYRLNTTEIIGITFRFNRILPLGETQLYWLKLSFYGPTVIGRIDFNKRNEISPKKYWHIFLKKEDIKAKDMNFKTMWRALQGEYKIDPFFQIYGPIQQIELPKFPQWQNVFMVSGMKFTPQLEFDHKGLKPEWNPSTMEFDISGTERYEVEKKFAIAFNMPVETENTIDGKTVEVRLVGSLDVVTGHVCVREGYARLKFLRSPLQIKNFIEASKELCPVGISDSFESMDEFYLIPLRNTTVVPGSVILEEDNFMGPVLKFKINVLPNEEVVPLPDGQDALENKCLIRIPDFMHGYIAATIDVSKRLIEMKDIYYDKNQKSGLGYFENSLSLSNVKIALNFESKKPEIWSYVDIAGPWVNWPNVLDLSAIAQTVEKDEYKWKSLPEITEVNFTNKNGENTLTFTYSKMHDKINAVDTPIRLIYITGEQYEVRRDKITYYKQYIYAAAVGSSSKIQVRKSYGKLENQKHMGDINWLLNREIDHNGTGERFIRISEPLPDINDFDVPRDILRKLKWEDAYILPSFAPSFSNIATGNPTLTFEVSNMASKTSDLEMFFVFVNGWTEPIIATINRKQIADKGSNHLWSRKIQIRVEFPNGVKNSTNLKDIIERINSAEKKYQIQLNKIILERQIALKKKLAAEQHALEQRKAAEKINVTEGNKAEETKDSKENFAVKEELAGAAGVERRSGSLNKILIQEKPAIIAAHRSDNRVKGIQKDGTQDISSKSLNNEDSKDGSIANTESENDQAQDEIDEYEQTLRTFRTLSVSTMNWKKENFPEKGALEFIECQDVIDITSVMLSDDGSVLTITYGDITVKKRKLILKKEPIQKEELPKTAHVEIL